MASGKIGSLVYDVIADTRQFNKSMGLTRSEFNLLKKEAKSLRTPMERMHADFDLIARAAKGDAAPIEVLARKTAKLSLETKEGAIEARKFADRLRAEARALFETEKKIGQKNKVRRQEILQLHKTAKAIDLEVTKLHREKAATLAAEKAKKQHAAASLQQAGASKGLSAQLVAIGKHIGFITAGYAALRQAGLSISDALELERSQKQFEVFTGSVSQSKKLIADLRDFSAKTPLTFSGSQQAVKTLMQYGVSVDDVMTRLKQLGDISGGSLESLQRLSLAFGQINANTRLQGQELRQLIEAGFNPLQVISEQTGESMQSLRDKMADGAISAQDVANALRDATGEGGRFNDMLKTIGEDTAFGQIQVLKGEIEKLRADIGAGAAENLGDSAAALTTGLQGFSDAAKGVAETTSEAEQSALTWAGRIATLYNPMLTGFFLVNEAFNASVSAQRKMLTETKNAKKETLDLTEVLKTDAEKKQELFDASDAGAAIRKRLRDLDLERKQLGMTADEKEIAAAKEAGASKVTVKMLEVELRLLAMAKQEREEKAELAEKEAKALQDQIKAEEKRKKSLQDFAKTLGEEINKATVKPLDKFVQDINAINVLMQRGFIDHAQARQLRNQREKNFLKENKKDIAASQSATAATEGSREEFQLLAQINRQNQDTQRRHNEAQKLRAQMFGALKDNAGAVNNLPAALAELFPEPVGE